MKVRRGHSLNSYSLETALYQCHHPESLVCDLVEKSQRYYLTSILDPWWAHFKDITLFCAYESEKLLQINHSNLCSPSPLLQSTPGAALAAPFAYFLALSATDYEWLLRNYNSHRFWNHSLYHGQLLTYFDFLVVGEIFFSSSHECGHRKKFSTHEGTQNYHHPYSTIIIIISWR